MGTDFRSGLVSTIVSLGAVTAVNYALPLATIPYLTRTLGATTWGVLAFAQSFAQYAMLTIEFGFGLSASREIARTRDNHARCSEVLAGVFGAKIVLSSLLILIAIGAFVFIDKFRKEPLLLFVATLWAFAQGMNMMWFYLGLDRTKWFAKVDVAAKMLASGLVFFVVHAPEHAWRVLLLQACASVAATGYGLVVAHRDYSFILPSWLQIRDSLGMGFPFFLQRASSSLYTVGNAFILGLFVSPIIVAYYAGAERIVRACLGLLTPINQALYPRMSHIAYRSEDEAYRIGKKVVLFMTCIGAAMTIGLEMFAPWIVRTGLGPEFNQAVPVLRILGLLPMIIAASNALGTQMMLPMGLEKKSTIILMSAGLFNVISSIALAPRFMHLGMAGTVTVAEGLVTGLMAYYLWRRKRDRVPSAEAAVATNASV